MKKVDRERIWLKYDKHCGYCGRAIEFRQMQVDHIHPLWSQTIAVSKGIDVDSLENRMPSCRRCNHYKREKDLEAFRTAMITLHERVAKPYINKVAIDYGIITVHPFNGIFYFESEYVE